MTVTNLKTVTVGQSDETFGIFHCCLARMRPDRNGAAAASLALASRPKRGAAWTPNRQPSTQKMEAKDERIPVCLDLVNTNGKHTC